jgi:hypothetical protein
MLLLYLRTAREDAGLAASVAASNIGGNVAYQSRPSVESVVMVAASPSLYDDFAAADTEVGGKDEGNVSVSMQESADACRSCCCY